MKPEDKKILQQITTERNLSASTIKNYEQSIRTYTESQQKTLTELLEEAENEEEQGIRLKKRTIKKRLTTYHTHLNQKGLSSTTIKKQVQIIRTIYHHYEIQIPTIPTYNTKHIKDYEPIYYDDLPSKELIREAIMVSSPNMKAVILFIVSSGCSREETLSLTIQDFITATSEYHHSNNIYDVINELKEKEDIIPVFKLKRRKTNQYYYTFCTPEAVRSIIYYLESRKDPLLPDSKLFKFEKSYFQKKFTALNRQLGDHHKGAYGIMRSHMLRKFHASNLARGENRLTVEEIDSLQGRTKNMIHQSYFLDDPQELKKKYIRNIGQVTILDKVHTITLDSPEVQRLKEKADKIDELERLVKTILKKNGGTPREDVDGEK